MRILGIVGDFKQTYSHPYFIAGVVISKPEGIAELLEQPHDSYKECLAILKELQKYKDNYTHYLIRLDRYELEKYGPQSCLVRVGVRLFWCYPTHRCLVSSRWEQIEMPWGLEYSQDYSILELRLARLYSRVARLYWEQRSPNYKLLNQGVWEGELPRQAVELQLRSKP